MVIFMQIKQIYQKDYPNNKKITYEYDSDQYYEFNMDILADNKGWIISWKLKPFTETFHKYEECPLFNDYKMPAEYYLVLNENEEEIGYLVIGYVTWNKLARVWDLSITDNYRRKGIGTKLLQLAENKAREWNCRALILETQSSNFKAIKFYLNFGFSLSGYDQLCYSNQDIERKEIRIEMGKYLIN